MPCNITQDFVWSFNKQLGNCYTYNSGYDSNGTVVPLKKSIQSGNLNRLGLRLTLFDSLPVILARIAQQGVGFVIKINNNTYDVGGNNEVDLLASVQNNVEIERVYTSQLAMPYSDCLIHEEDDSSATNTFHSDLYDLLIDNNIRYRQNDCIDLCKLQYIIQMCNCSLIQFNTYNLFPNVSICNTPSGFICSSNLYYTQLVSGEFLKVIFFSAKEAMLKFLRSKCNEFYRE